jgi:hypothetical protein
MAKTPPPFLLKALPNECFDGSWTPQPRLTLEPATLQLQEERDGVRDLRGGEKTAVERVRESGRRQRRGKERKGKAGKERKERNALVDENRSGSVHRALDLARLTSVEGHLVLRDVVDVLHDVDF